MPPARLSVLDAEDRQRIARLRLRARRQRDGQLRRRAIVLALTTFAVLWVAVFAQMVSGHDPVLGAGAQLAALDHRSGYQAQRQTSAPRVGEEQQFDPESGSAEEGAPSSGTPNGVPTPAPVVTSQS
jgi:hypothetical protein